MFPPWAPFFHALTEPSSRGLRSGKARLRRHRLSAVELASQGCRVDEENELSLPVDLHNWDELSKPLFKLGITVYSNLFESEVKLIEDAG